MSKTEKVPIFGIFSPKTILMLRIGLKIRVGRVTGTTHIFYSQKFEGIMLMSSFNYRNYRSQSKCVWGAQYPSGRVIDLRSSVFGSNLARGTVLCPLSLLRCGSIQENV